MKTQRALACLVLLVAAIVSVSAPGCSSGIGLAAPRSMNHPVDVAFACFDVSVVGSPMVVPLHNCALYVDVPSNTREPPLLTQYHMHALVTQSTRGEVGAVDLIARGVLDSDMSVPGYTFVPVGQLPTVIIVPPMDPTCTYVASRGPVDDVHPGISIIDTRRFRSGAGLDHNPFPLHAPYVLPSAPSDMVLAPDAQSLWVTMDALGVLVRIPITGSCQLGDFDLVVPLDEVVPAQQPYMTGTTADLTYECGLAMGVQPIQPDVSVAPRTPDLAPDAQPEPVAIEIDTVNDMLLIADRGLPMIHRVNMFDGSLASPLATGVPVRDVAVTPLVPDSYQLVADPQIATLSTNQLCMSQGLHQIGDVVPAPASSITFSRYVYAIDDTDGTVMAIEYTGDDTRPGFGEVIPVDVVGARRPDRLSMPIVARSLTIITPQYDTTAADPRLAPPDANCVLPGNPNGYGLCLPSDPAESAAPSPTVLRGVFLVVAGADGALRFIDIYDLDAPCRGRPFGSVAVTVAGDGTLSDACTNPTVIGDEAVYIRRHRPRSQQILTTFLDTTIGPTVYFASGGNTPLDTTGRAIGEPVHVPCTQQTDCAGAQICDLISGQCESESQLPELRPVPGGTCPDNLSTVWPNDGSGPPVYCSLIDPFAVIGETWSATYEGTIPGTFTASANPLFANAPMRTQFTGDFDTRLDYCELGVIGRADALTDIANDPMGLGIAPERFHQGDMLAITGAMMESSLDNREICRHVVGIDLVGQTQLPILVPIQHAFTSPTGILAPYTGRIHVDPLAALEDRAFATTTPCMANTDCATASSPHDTCDQTAHTCITVPTVSDAVDCYGDTLLTIDVRSYHAFTVSGTRSGFHARIDRHDVDGSCHFDNNLSRLSQGHAFDEQLFSNGRIAFVPSGTGTRTIANQLAEIRMVLTNGPSQLGIDLSLSTTGARGVALPTGVRYSNEMWALYAIETERRGLVEMTLRPLAVTATAYQ